MGVSIEQRIAETVAMIDSGEMTNERTNHFISELQLIGQTAAFFGGYAGMKELCDASVVCGLEREIPVARVGYWLNKVWDGISGWTE